MSCSYSLTDTDLLHLVLYISCKIMFLIGQWLLLKTPTPLCLRSLAVYSIFSSCIVTRRCRDANGLRSIPQKSGIGISRQVIPMPCLRVGQIRVRVYSLSQKSLVVLSLCCPWQNLFINHLYCLPSLLCLTSTLSHESFQGIASQIHHVNSYNYQLLWKSNLKLQHFTSSVKIAPHNLLHKLGSLHNPLYIKLQTWCSNFILVSVICWSMNLCYWLSFLMQHIVTS